jgi:hypothetical protein
MAKKLWTERHGPAKPRTTETLDEPTRNGLLELVASKVDQEWFGDVFPDFCTDGRGNASCDKRKLRTMLAAYSLIDPGEVDRASVADPQVFDRSRAGAVGRAARRPFSDNHRSLVEIRLQSHDGGVRSPRPSCGNSRTMLTTGSRSYSQAPCSEGGSSSLSLLGWEKSTPQA